jgi:hypothetical protein
MKFPRSDDKKLVFPYNYITGTYNEHNCDLTELGQRCLPTDVFKVLDTIYHETNNLAILRTMFKVKATFSLLLLSSLLLVIGGAATASYAVMYFGLVATLVIALMFYWLYSKAKKEVSLELPFTKAKIQEIFQRFYDPFHVNHLRWAVPDTCLWLELWLDWKLPVGTENREYVFDIEDKIEEATQNHTETSQDPIDEYDAIHNAAPAKRRSFSEFDGRMRVFAGLPQKIEDVKVNFKGIHAQS